MPTNAMRGIAVLLFAFILAAPIVGAASFAPPPPNALEILWNDYCARTAAAECAVPTTTPSPAPTATPTTTPTPTATSTATPTPTVAPTSTAMSTPTPTPTTAPTNTPTPPSGTIGQTPPSGTGPLVCPSGYINWESRGWWTPSGQPFDQYRGIDAEICWPADEHLASGTTTFLLHIQLRRLHAPITFIRIGFGPDGSVNGFYQSVHLVPDAAGYGEWYIPAPTKANTHVGYNEYRVTANVGSDEDGQRQYQSTGLQAWTTSNSSSYRSRPWWESRGWYPDTNYVNNRMHSVPPTAPVSGTYSFKWECTRTGTGTLSYHVVYVDADTHAIPMVLPRKYAEGSGGFNGTVSIDTTALSNGRHKVLTRCDDTVGAGTTSALTQFLINVQNAAPAAAKPIGPPATPNPTPTAEPELPGFDIHSDCAPDADHYSWTIDASGFDPPLDLTYSWTSDMADPQHAALPSFTGSFSTDRSGDRVYAQLPGSVIETAPAEPNICEP